MWVKICGTTNLDDALLAADAGAAAVGFVFAPSKRQMTGDRVREITAMLPKGISRVGVFTSTDAEEILATVSVAGLTAVQLHSEYSPDLVRAVRSGSGGQLRVLQVVDVPAGASEAAERTLEVQLRALAEIGDVDVLLDTSVRGASGGTGIPFDWKRAGALLRRVWDGKSRMQLGLAGGLTPENVAHAIAVMRPDFVDVVSGVEAMPGGKDPARVRAFLANALKHESSPKRA